MVTVNEPKRLHIRESLAARLILVMGGLVVGTALVLSALAVFLLGTALEENARGRIDTARDFAADAIRARISDSAALVHILQDDPGFLALLRTHDASVADAVRSRAKRSFLTADLLVVTASGKRLIAGGAAAGIDGQQLLDGLQRTVSVTGLVRTSDCTILAVTAIMVREPGAEAAALVAVQPLDDAFAAHLKDVSKTDAWIVCGSASQATAAGPRNLELDKELLSSVIGQGTMALGGSRVDGIPGYGYYVPLFDWQGEAVGAFGVSQPVQVVTRARDSVAGIFLVAVLLFSGLVLSEVYVLARSITQPLRRLTAATHLLGEGDLTTPLAVSGRDDIGVLAASFESMRVRLATTYAELERERNRYREFLALMPHEFKTPLAALSASLELLESEVDAFPSEQRVLLASLRRSVIRLTSLVDNLLDTASIQAGKFTVNAEPNDLRHILDEATHTTELLLEQKGQSLDIRAEPELPQVMADPRRIAQVLINLISNAHKYGPPGTAVSVAAVRRGNEAYIAVSDKGAGISAADQRGLFQRFIRAPGGDSNERGGISGVGVGLAIVREIVTMHGGQVGMESEPGQGTTVWFTLPLAITSGEPLQQANPI